MEAGGPRGRPHHAKSAGWLLATVGHVPEGSPATGLTGSCKSKSQLAGSRRSRAAAAPAEVPMGAAEGCEGL